MKRTLFILICTLLTVATAIAEINYANTIEKARRGDKIAQYNIGYFYYYGAGGVSRDYKQAFSWFQKSADQGLADAQFLMAICYAEGHGTDVDTKMVVHWLTKAANHGLKPAQAALAAAYYDGDGVEQNYKQAFYWATKSAEKGDMGSQRILGNCYQFGKGTTKDTRQAVYWYSKAAEQQDTYSQYRLGVAYENGEGVTQNAYQASVWYKKAAENGYRFAQLDLGKLYLSGGNNLSKDYESSIFWLEKAINNKKGDGDNFWFLQTLLAKDVYLYPAYNELGDCYYNGTCGKSKDYKKAFKNYEEAAYNGYKIAYLGLGNCYYNGRGVSRDYKQAFDCYSIAAEEGSLDAQYNLANCYFYGNGVEQNYKEAFDWYIAASYHGHTDAERQTAYCYKNGIGVEQDYGMALFLYEHMVVANGHLDVCLDAGECCEITEQYDEAAYYYLLLIEKGNATQKAKAEKRLQALSDAYISTLEGGSVYAYQYIHSASITITAADINEYIYAKKVGAKDFEYKATGSWTNDTIETGKYIVYHTRDRWHPRYDTILVTHPATSLTLKPLTPKKGTLKVLSKPVKGNVYVDGNMVGVTPWQGELQMGDHNVYVLKKGRINSETQKIYVPYNSQTSASFKLKNEAVYGYDWHPDHYLEPMYGLGLHKYKFGPGYYASHHPGLRYGWIPKRFGLEVAAMYGITEKDLSATVGPLFRLTDFHSKLSLQLSLGAGAMYRFTDKHVTWAADAALRFGFKERGDHDGEFGWWSFSLGTRYYDGMFIPNLSVSLFPIRTLILAAIEKEDFPCIYAEFQNGYEFHSRQWMMGAHLSYIPTHLGVGSSLMFGFEGGWDITAGPVFRLTPDRTVLDLQVYQGFGYGEYDYHGFMGETALRFAFGKQYPYFGMWSFNLGCVYDGKGSVGFTFGFSLPIVSIIGTAGLASIFYFL